MWLVGNDSVAEAAVCEIEHPFHTVSRHSGAWAWCIISDICLCTHLKDKITQKALKDTEQKQIGGDPE